MFDDIVSGFMLILNVWTFVALGVGIIVGTIFGAIPGLSTNMAMAIFVPVTFYMEPLVGIPFLLGLYKGGIFGGSITAILIATPGTGAAVATVFDGYQLNKQGKGVKALKMALYSSVIGEVFGELILLFLVGWLAKVALAFGPVQTFAVLFFAYTIIAGLSGDSLTKGIISAAAGLFVSTIGMDAIIGTSRFTFGNMNLRAGLDFIPILIGLFAFSEVLLQVEQHARGVRAPTVASVDMKGKSDNTRVTKEDWRKCLPYIASGCGIGTFIGLLPGIGQPVAALLSYGVAKNHSKDPDSFGKGNICGVAAPEAAHNAVNGSAMVPMLALGIPGDTVCAILLGALMVQGLTPGPMLFRTNGPMVYALILSMVIGNILFFLIDYLFIPVVSKIALIPKNMMLPGIIVFTVIGAYAAGNDTFHILVMIIFGFIGYFMNKAGFPTAPFVIAFLLGAQTETTLSQSLLMSKGSLAVFFTNPLSCVFMLITAFVLVGVILKEVRKSRAAKAAKAVEQPVQE